MKSTMKKSTRLGDLIVAAFEGAAQYSNDPREVSDLATRAVTHMLRSARKTSTPRSRLLAVG